MREQQFQVYSELCLFNYVFVISSEECEFLTFTVPKKGKPLSRWLKRVLRSSLYGHRSRFMYTILHVHQITQRIRYKLTAVSNILLQRVPTIATQLCLTLFRARVTLSDHTCLTGRSGVYVHRLHSCAFVPCSALSSRVLPALRWLPLVSSCWLRCFCYLVPPPLEVFLCLALFLRLWVTLAWLFSLALFLRLRLPLF